MKSQNDTDKRKRTKTAVSPSAKVAIRKLPTGVRGLDAILGGGIPEFSFNIIAGTPGCGKTTMAHQIVFANATVKKPALFFTVLGEPALKMLRYRQQINYINRLPGGRRAFGRICRNWAEVSGSPESQRSIGI
jgi:circadian clock protein KaiC